MSKISTYLSKILSAVYGREVRQSIHDAISQCYDDVNNPDLNTSAFKTAIQEKIDDGSIPAMTIADGSITQEKLSPDIHFGVQNGEVTPEKIANCVYPYHGLNWLNYDTAINGYTINSTTGEKTVKASFSVSEKIDISGYVYILQHGDNTGRLNFYKSNDEFISSVSFSKTDPAFTEIPNGAVTLIVSFPTNATTNIVIPTNNNNAVEWRYPNPSEWDTLLGKYKDDVQGKPMIDDTLPSAFSDGSVPLNAINGVNLTRYNLFNYKPTVIDGIEKQILSKNVSIYYVYNFGERSPLFFRRLYEDGAIMTKYFSGFTFSYSGYKPTMIDFTDYDVIHGDCIYTEVSKEKNKSTPVTTENIMISTQSDLTEFYSYESGYFNPSDAVKRLIQSANESNVKVYDGGVMMTLGDSYTAYMNTFYDSFAKKHGLVQDNRGVASSTIAGDTGGNIGFKPFWNRLDTAISEYEAGLTINEVTYSADDVKLIVFMGGANDWSTVNDTVDRLGKGAFETDKGKLYGALNYIFATLLSTFKNADIVVILQPVNYNSTVPTSEEGAKNVGFESLEQAQGMTNTQLSTYLMTKKEKIIREMAQMYGLTICDCCFEWYNPNNPVDAETYWQTDKLHLSRAGHEAVIKKLEGTVNDLPVRRN